MTIPLTDSGAGLFEILGKFAHLLNTLNAARGTTVAAEALDAINQYKTKSDTTLAFDRAIERFASGEQSWRQGGDGLASNIAATCRNLLREFVQADDANIGNSLTDQLEHLIDDMVAQDAYVSANSIGSSTAFVADGSTERDLGWIIGYKNITSEQSADNVLAETLVAEVTAASLSGSALRIRGERSARNNLSEEFPAGSGVRKNVTALTAAGSLLDNADFSGAWYDLGSGKYAPAGWTITGGTDYTQTAVPLLTATITGTPTTGEFTLRLHNPITNYYYGSAAVAYNATAADVEAAVQAIPGYGNATVTRTGTAPNYVYTITCTGLTGDPGAPGAYSSFDAGGVSGAKSTSGDDLAITGSSLVIGTAGAASTTHSIEQTVELQPGVPYVVAVRYRTAAGAISGGFSISLRDSIGGSLVTDSLGGNLSSSVLWTGTSFGVLRTHGMIVVLPENVQQPVAVQIATNNPTRDLYIGEVIIAEATELYAGGPYVAAMHGDNPPSVGQQYTLALTNDRVSAWQQAFDQLFDMRAKRLVLPTSGSTLLNDTLIG